MFKYVNNIQGIQIGTFILLIFKINTNDKTFAKKEFNNLLRISILKYLNNIHGIN